MAAIFNRTRAVIGLATVLGLVVAGKSYVDRGMVALHDGNSTSSTPTDLPRALGQPSSNSTATAPLFIIEADHSAYSSNASEPAAEVGRQAGLTAGEYAAVVLTLEVLSDNRLGRVQVEQSSGNSIADRVAQTYVQALPWVSARVAGQSVASTVRYVVRFHGG